MMRVHQFVGLLLLLLMQSTTVAQVTGLRFQTEQTVAELGRSRVIAFMVDKAPDDRQLDYEVRDQQILEVIQPPAVLGEYDTGYIRVRGLQEGSTELTIAGQTLPVRVVGQRSPEVLQVQQPQIVGPASGASIWGQFSVGVRWRAELDVAQVKLEIRSASGRIQRIDPIETFGNGSPRHAVFEIDADTLDTGPAKLLPFLRDSRGEETFGPEVTINIIRPESANIVSEEAETSFDFERPTQFQDARMMIGRDPAASGGAYFSNAAATPSMCLPIHIGESGMYQVMLVASGSMGGGALPTIGLFVDGGQYALTNARLVSEDWHRIAVGVPIFLDAGTRILTPYFANDFAVSRLADRNLRLDRIEITRVEDDQAPARAAGAGDAMAMMSMMTMGGMGAKGDDPTGASDPFAQATSPLRIALSEPLEGRTIAGALNIRATCWAQGADPSRDPSRTPVVSLLVNGATIATQRSLAPRFLVEASTFCSGPNTIQLVAELDSGGRVATPVQTMLAPWGRSAEEVAPQVAHRYSMHDEGWDQQVREHLKNEHNPPEQFAAALYSNAQLALTLPEDMTGEYQIFLNSRAQHFQGAPVLEVHLDRDGTLTEIGSIESPTWWNTRLAGVAHLEPGPKRLVVSFNNDLHTPDKGDRNVWVQALGLRNVESQEDAAAPIVRLLYPPSGHDVYEADAVVIEAADDVGVVDAQLLIDDIATGMVIPLTNKPGRAAIPLLARFLEPGAHTITVQVTDARGQIGISAPCRITVLDEPPAQPGQYARAAHLLNRLAFGPDMRELADVLTLGEDVWLESRLLGQTSDPAEAAAIASGLVRFRNNRSTNDVARRAVDHAIRTRNPVRARFVLWTQNHFSTWIRKTEGDRKWNEHIAFSTLGFSPFRDLLVASSESPAMLRYLDQDRSYAGRLNENYAREILELHTLGVDGGYVQDDVTRLASLMTGWTAVTEGDGRSPGEMRDYSFCFDPALSDGQALRIIGMEFPETKPTERYNRARLAIEVIASHPSTARFVSRKLAEHYVGLPAPDDLVDHLAEVFARTDGNMRQIMRALVAHDAFWESADSPRMAHPIDYAVRLCRSAAYDSPWAAADFLQRSGAGLFDRVTPDGYPEEDPSYADSNALLQRWSLAQSATWSLGALVPSQWRYTNETDEPTWAQRVVDTVAVRLTGNLLSETSNRAALNLIENSTGTSDERVRQIAVLIAQFPEASLR